MGHDSVRAAMIYQHAAAEADQKIADTLDRRIGEVRGDLRARADGTWGGQSPSRVSGKLGCTRRDRTVPGLVVVTLAGHGLHGIEHTGDSEALSKLMELLDTPTQPSPSSRREH